MTFAKGLEWMTSETTDARIPDPAWRMEIKGIIGFTFLVKSRRTAIVRGSMGVESACTLAHRVRVPQTEPMHDTRFAAPPRHPGTGCNSGQKPEKSRPDASLASRLRLESS